MSTNNQREDVCEFYQNQRNHEYPTKPPNAHLYIYNTNTDKIETCCCHSVENPTPIEAVVNNILDDTMADDDFWLEVPHDQEQRQYQISEEELRELEHLRQLYDSENSFGTEIEDSVLISAVNIAEEPQRYILHQENDMITGIIDLEDDPGMPSCHSPNCNYYHYHQRTLHYH